MVDCILCGLSKYLRKLSGRLMCSEILDSLRRGGFLDGSV